MRSSLDALSIIGSKRSQSMENKEISISIWMMIYPLNFFKIIIIIEIKLFYGSQLLHLKKRDLKQRCDNNQIHTIFSCNKMPSHDQIRKSQPHILSRNYVIIRKQKYPHGRQKLLLKVTLQCHQKHPLSSLSKPSI